MQRLIFGLAMLALLSGCVSVHVHFPKAEPAETSETAPPATTATPP